MQRYEKNIEGQKISRKSEKRHDTAITNILPSQILYDNRLVYSVTIIIFVPRYKNYPHAEKYLSAR